MYLHTQAGYMYLVPVSILIFRPERCYAQAWIFRLQPSSEWEKTSLLAS
jgi:hypothetical protein